VASKWRMNVFDMGQWGTRCGLIARLLPPFFPDRYLIRGDEFLPPFIAYWVPSLGDVIFQSLAVASGNFPYGYPVEPDN